jgi:hypothetical protein
LVEHLTFNEDADGSSPSRDTIITLEQNCLFYLTLSSSGQGHYHFMVGTEVQIL